MCLRDFKRQAMMILYTFKQHGVEKKKHGIKCNVACFCCLAYDILPAN